MWKAIKRSLWPFDCNCKPSKPKSESTCCSGVLTCDGRNHVWSRWKRTETPFLIINTLTGESTNGTKAIQERTCVVCNFIEQKSLDGDPL